MLEDSKFEELMKNYLQFNNETIHYKVKQFYLKISEKSVIELCFIGFNIQCIYFYF